MDWTIGMDYWTDILTSNLPMKWGIIVCVGLIATSHKNVIGGKPGGF